MGIRRAFAGSALSVSCLAAVSAQIHIPTTFLSYAQAAPVFAALDESPPVPAEWARWVEAADAATRARVAQGDETSVVNLLLFGTSFTTQSRITSRQLNGEHLGAAMEQRLRDLERAIAEPGTNERLQFARRMLGDGSPVKARLLAMVDRLMKEAETHARLMDHAHALGDPSVEFAERSRLYRERGLSSDTSIRVNLAIEEALRRAHASGAARGPVRRVAVIGPGLDVVDKQEGYDFYAPQTIQPFAIVDSLIRLGLAEENALQVTTFDVSARVNGHLVEMERRARAGTPYVVYLPLDGGVEWTPDMIDYFERFGDRVGDPRPVTIPAGLEPLRLRAVAVRPPVVRRISARDLNITAQRLTLSDAERFDLIVGTNIFVYYDRLQQGLAMVSVADMLRPGGLLLSNNALVEAPTAGIRSIGYSRTQYSSREEDGDVIVWYQKN